MNFKSKLIYYGVMVLLMVVKDYSGYPFNGFYRCRDVFIWFQGEIVSCKYLMLPSRHGLHMDPKYYCTEYTAHRCCETCALLDRHNYRVLNGFYQETTTDSQTTTDIYDYIRVNEIYKAPSIDVPVNSDIIRYKVLDTIKEVKTTTVTAPLLPVERKNYNILSEVVAENTTFKPVPIEGSNVKVIKVFEAGSTSVPVTTARNASVYRVSERKSAHATLFTVSHFTDNKKLLTTEIPPKNQSVLNPQNETKPNLLPAVQRTLDPNQNTGQTLEQFFTIPPNVQNTEQNNSTIVIVNNTQTLMETTTTLPVFPALSSKPTFFSTKTRTPTLVTTTQKPTGQEKRIRDGCVDVGIWVVNGSVPCDYLVKDNKYGLNRNQMYFCNRYPLTSCCDTCKRINHEIDIKLKGSQPPVKEMPEVHAKEVNNENNVVAETLKEITSTAIPLLVQDSPVPVQNKETQNITIQNQLRNAKDPEPTQITEMKQGEVVENVRVISEDPLALRLRPKFERTTGRITTKTPDLHKHDGGSPDNRPTVDRNAAQENITISEPTNSPSPISSLKTTTTTEISTEQQSAYVTTTLQTTLSKGTSKRPCKDIGIWFRSGSISCEYLLKDHVLKLNKNPLYYCNSYPLTSCCKTCALINLILRSK